MPSTIGVVNSSNHDFTPADLKPYVWLDASDVSTLTFDTGVASYIEDGYNLFGGGASSNRAILGAPFGSSLDITGNVDIAVLASAASWSTPTQVRYLFARGHGSSSTAFRFILNTDGTLAIVWMESDGLTTSTLTSSVATGLADNEKKWVRVTLTLAGNCTARFYLSSDGQTWTQLGADVLLGRASSQRSGPSGDMSIGGYWVGQAWYGKIYRAILRSSIDGTIVLDADFESVLNHSLQFFDKSTRRNSITIVSTGNGRAVSAITPRYKSYPTAGAFVQGTLASMPALRSDSKTGKLGLFFNGAHSIAAQSAADWKFLHDGTQILVVLVWQITVQNPDIPVVPLSTAFGWEASSRGFWFGYDDRSGNGTNNALNAYISNAGVIVCSASSLNNAFTTLETHVTSVIFKPLETKNRGNLFVDDKQVAVDSDIPATPSSVDPIYALRIGATGNSVYPTTGIVHELIILSGPQANETARKQLVGYLTDKYRIGLDNTADWLNGTYTSTATHHVVTFRGDGSFTPLRPLNVEYLVVGGGGAGGGGNGGGGGGAGGVVMGSMTMTPRMYAVNVGAGGVPGVSRSQDSFLGNREIVAIGGGRGSADISAENGGSGGGGNSTYPFGLGTTGQGYAGGTGGTPGVGAGGGGGGAGGAGQDGSNASQTNAGNGGDGIEWPTGSGVYYASGGGGGGSAGGPGSIITVIVPGGGGRGATGATNGESGTANTGGGGGATRNATPGSGGSGIVIIRWLKTT